MSGGLITITGDGSGIMSGDVEVTGSNAVVVGIREIPVDIDVSAAPSGVFLRKSSSDGELAAGAVVFSALSGSVSPGATLRVALATDVDGAEWTVVTASGIVGNLITLSVTGRGTLHNAAPGTLLRLDSLTPVSGGQMRFAASSGAIPAEAFGSGTVTFSGATNGTPLPAGTILEVGAGGQTFTVTVGGVVAGGAVAITAVSDLAGTLGNMPATTVLRLQTPIAGIPNPGVCGAFTGGVNPAIIRLTSDLPGMMWTVTSATGIVGGFITATVRGTCGLPSAASVRLTTAIAGVTQTGVVVSSFGLSGIGTVDAGGIIGGTDVWVATPITEIQRKRVFEADKLPNGDARPGIRMNDPTFNNWAGVQRATNPMRNGDELHFRAGDWYWNTPIESCAEPTSPTYNAAGNYRFTGDNASGSATPVTRLIFNGNDVNKGALFRAYASQITYSRLALYQRSAVNKNMRGMIIVDLPDNTTVDGQTATKLIFEHCLFYNNEAHTQGSVVDWGVAVGALIGQNHNFEDYRFYDCNFKNFRRTGVYFATGQPYNTTFEKCDFNNFTAANPSAAGVKVSTPSCNVTFRDCNFTRLTRPFWPTTNVKMAMYGGQMEQCKTMVSDNGGPGARAGWNINDVRVSTQYYDQAGADLDSPILAASRRFISYGCGSALILTNVSFDPPSGEQADFRIYNVASATVVNGGSYPTRNFVEQANAIANSAIVDVLGAQGYSGANLQIIPDRRGSRNGTVLATITGGSTSVVVNFPLYEPSGGSTFDVRPTLRSVVNGGLPIPFSSTLARVQPGSVTQNSCVIEVETDPGALNTVTFACEIKVEA